MICLKRFFSQALSAIVMTSFCAAIAAPAQPDAGALRQQIEQERIVPLPGPAAPAESRPANVPSDAPAVTVTVQSFRFLGNTLLTGEELAHGIEHYLQRPIAFDELQLAIATVVKLYGDAGWLATAFLPRQEIVDGVVTIRIVEAIYSGAHLEGLAPARVPQSLIAGQFDAQLSPGQHLSLKNLDRALLLADDLPGVSVSGALHAGENAGETELLVHTEDEPAFGVHLLFDNAGARSTGATRAIAIARLNSPLDAGDQLETNLLHSEGNDYLWVNYSLPAGNDGWRLSANGSVLRYDLTASDFSALHGKGESNSVGVGGSYPLIRALQHNLYLELRLASDTYLNEANATTQSDYRINSMSATLTGNLFDEFAGGGSTVMTLGWSTGELDLGHLDFGETAARRGGYSKFEFRVSRQQTITSQLTFVGSVRGQLSSNDLDTSQRFYLGGPYGVRAYPVNEGSASQGEQINLELRQRLAYNVTLTGFYDWGHVGRAEGVSGYNLKGYGIGVSWQAANGVALESTVARRIGRNPNPASTGQDQDGSLDHTRLWLTLSYSF